jgi:hypothetical protein
VRDWKQAVTGVPAGDGAPASAPMDFSA